MDIPKKEETGKKSKKKKPEKEKPLEQTVYESYKQRGEIETMFDCYKNYLDADVSYMQNGRVALCKFYRHDGILQIVCEITAGRNPVQILAKGYY